eukprot:8935252-Alexandrium_andersonii.AAC.1
MPTCASLGRGTQRNVMLNKHSKYPCRMHMGADLGRASMRAFLGLHAFSSALRTSAGLAQCSTPRVRSGRGLRSEPSTTLREPCAF